MEIIFSKHAKDQMIERNISKDDILSVILNPDKIIRQSAGRSRVIKSIRKNNKDYLLITVFSQINPEQKKIITAFLTSKTNKYSK